MKAIKWVDDDGTEFTVERLERRLGYQLFCDNRNMCWIQKPNGETIPEDGFYKSIAVGRRVLSRISQ